VNGVEDVLGEGIDVGGLFCIWSVTQKNSKQTCFDLVNKPRSTVQNYRARARGRASAGSGPTWAGFGPSAVHCLTFSFIPRAKTIIEKCRKMLKL
jgi:meiotically up-regulated gene 157 (Mug157) protein